MAAAGFKTLDIVLPCYNPSGGWEANLIDSFQKIQAALPHTSIHLILVNDGSSKKIEAAEIEKIRSSLGIDTFSYLSHYPNRGKGYTLREGVQKTQSELVIFTDIDFPYQEKSLLDLYHKLNAGEGDIIPGVRDEQYYEGVPPTRRFISRSLRRMLKLFLGMEITDTQCGLKGFNAKGREIFLQTTINRFLFDLEFIFLGSNTKDIRITPCEVELKPEIIFSKMNWKVLVGELLNFTGIFLRFLKRKLFG